MVGMSILPQVLLFTEGQSCPPEHCTSWNVPAAVLHNCGDPEGRLTDLKTSTLFPQRLHGALLSPPNCHSTRRAGVLPLLF